MSLIYMDIYIYIYILVDTPSPAHRNQLANDSYILGSTVLYGKSWGSMGPHGNSIRGPMVWLIGCLLFCGLNCFDVRAAAVVVFGVGVVIVKSSLT